MEQLPRIAFVCPFDLDRLTGTPIRARTTIEALQSSCISCVVSTGGLLPHNRILSDIWEERRGRAPLFRLDRFTSGTLSKLKAFKPDVIHAVTSSAMLPAAIYKFRFRKTMVIFEMHGLSSYEMLAASWLSRFVFQSIDRIGTALADVVVAMSHTQRDLICNLYKARPEKVCVMWGPVNLHLFQYSDPPPAPPFIVGYLGNDHFWQGLDSILSAAPLLRNNENIRFVLGGMDPSPYKKLGLKNVTFAGVIPNGVVPAFLSQCHILLSPRRGGRVGEAQYPHKLSGYLAAGRPIIASDVNDQPLILEKADCGKVFPAENFEALSEAIVQILEVPEKRRLQMGINARRFAETHLSADSLARRLMGVYFCRKQSFSFCSG